jgi:hypothetical protein
VSDEPAAGELDEAAAGAAAAALLAAAICHAGIGARPVGTPALYGVLDPRPDSEAVDSVPLPLLTEAGFGPPSDAGAAGDDVPFDCVAEGAGVVLLGVVVARADGPMPKVEGWGEAGAMR